MRIIHTLRKRQALSEISREIGVVVIASMVIGPIVGNSFEILLTLFGTIISLLLFITSLSLAAN